MKEVLFVLFVQDMNKFHVEHDPMMLIGDDKQKKYHLKIFEVNHQLVKKLNFHILLKYLILHHHQYFLYQDDQEFLEDHQMI
jgi:hypothetical protein